MREDLTEKKITNQEGENSLESRFFGVNCLGIKGSNGRVLVCVLRDKSGKLNVKNFSIREYEKPKISQLSTLSYFVEDIIADQLLAIAKRMLKDLSVGSNGNDKILNDLSNRLIEKLKTHLNCSVLEFSEYIDMKDAYDEITFEENSNIRERIKSYRDAAESKLDELINKLANKYNTEFPKEDESRLRKSITGISEIRDVRFKSNNITTFLSSKEASAVSKKEAFDKELEELTKGYFLKSIEDRAEGLLLNFDDILPETSFIQVSKAKEIFKTLSELKKNLKKLRDIVIKLETRSFSIKEIDSLNEQFKRYNEKFINLGECIQKLAPPPLVLGLEKFNEFKQEINKIILELKNHITSDEKKSIKEEIESKLDDIVNKESSEDLIQAIEEIKIYILNKRPKIDEYRGLSTNVILFKSHSKLKDIVDKLNLIFDEFIKNNYCESIHRALSI